MIFVKDGKKMALVEVITADRTNQKGINNASIPLCKANFLHRIENGITGIESEKKIYTRRNE